MESTKTSDKNEISQEHSSEDTIVDVKIQNTYDKPRKGILRRIGIIFREAFKSLALFITILTISTHVYHAYYMFRHGDALRAEFNVNPDTDVQEKSAQADFTVFMLTKDRYTFQDTMKGFIEKGKNTKRKPFYLVIDYESKTPIQENNDQIYYLRKEPDATTTEGFNVWKGLAYAAKAIKSDRIFYFDSCNYPWWFFEYDKYIDNNTNLYYPNYEREYSSNFLVYKEDLIRFAEDMPVHLAVDPRTFFGGDQLMIWYFASYRSEYLGHLTHTSIANYDKFHTHHIAIWRLFLYMNRYARPVRRPNEMILDKCSSDKKILCVYGGIVSKILALPGIWHALDAIMNFEFLFTLIFAIVNRTEKILWAILIVTFLTFSAICIAMYPVRKILKWFWTKMMNRLNKRQYQKF